MVKVGRSVSADLRRLANKWSLHELHEQLKDLNAEHIIELSVLAKMKGLVSDARVSLGTLTGICLRHSLQKTNALRLSRWSEPSLSEEQYIYAARDAYASLCIWQHLVTKPTVGLPVTDFIDGVHVDIRGGRSIVAHGQIITQPSMVTICHAGRFVEVKVTPTKAVVQVDKIINGAFEPSAHQMTLDQLGPTPFVLLTAKSMLTTRNISPPEFAPPDHSDGLCIPTDLDSYSPPEVLLPTSDDMIQMQKHSSRDEDEQDEDEDEDEEPSPGNLANVEANLQDEVYFIYFHVCQWVLTYVNRMWKCVLILNLISLLPRLTLNFGHITLFLSSLSILKLFIQES